MALFATQEETSLPNAVRPHMRGMFQKGDGDFFLFLFFFFVTEMVNLTIKQRNNPNMNIYAYVRLCPVLGQSLIKHGPNFFASDNL